MSMIFFDGFDYVNGWGPGGRKYDQGSGGSVTSGRFGGQALNTGGGSLGKTFSTSHSGMIVGFAMNVGNFFDNS